MKLVYVVIEGYDIERVYAFSTLQAALQFTAERSDVRTEPFECIVDDDP